VNTLTAVHLTAVNGEHLGLCIPELGVHQTAVNGEQSSLMYTLDW